MRFFIDNCIPFVLVKALRILAEFQGYEIKHLREKYPEGAKDREWIPSLAREGDWVIVSGDPRITRGKHEKAAWLESGMTAFFFGSGWTNQKFWNQAAHLVKWWPYIVQHAREATSQAGFEIPVLGTKVRQIDVERLREGLR